MGPTNMHLEQLQRIRWLQASPWSCDQQHLITNVVVFETTTEICLCIVVINNC